MRYEISRHLVQSASGKSYRDTVPIPIPFSYRLVNLRRYAGMCHPGACTRRRRACYAIHRLTLPLSQLPPPPPRPPLGRVATAGAEVTVIYADTEDTALVGNVSPTAPLWNGCFNTRSSLAPKPGSRASCTTSTSDYAMMQSL